MLGGVMGKVLRINLTRETCTVEEIEEELYRKYIGSRGLGSKLFYDKVGPEVEPFAEDNKIFIMTGLLNGTKVPATPKHTWVCKSPLNSFYGEGSTSGGRFAIYLKQNGYDGLIIEGKAESPVYMILEEGNVSFHRAEKHNGLRVSETERMLKERYPGIQTAIIGPAGENLVRYAAVRVERRTVGRTGIGAVMGSKNLKAIGVLPGEREVSIDNKRRYSDLVQQFYKNIRETEFTSRVRRLYGTTHMFEFINENGVMPTRNFQKSKFEREVKDFIHTTIRDKYVIRDEACYRCPIVCGKKMLAREGRYAGATSSGPEWETMWAFGPQCDNNNFESVLKANELCNELGLDTISTGNIAGFTMELYENDLVGEDDSGYSLDWGNEESILRLIHDIAYRRNFGDRLAEGSKRVARQLGVEDIAIQVKGLELPAYDPRSIWGMGLAYATSSRGGCHLRSFTPGAELGGLGGGRTSIEGKAEFVVNDQNIRGLYEAAGQCFTATAAVDPEFFAELLSSVTGMELKEGDLFTIGERIYNVERLLAVREGIGKREDTLPGRLFKEEVKNGPAAGSRLPEEEFSKMLAEYYTIRNWNSKNGVPEKEKLRALGI